MIFSSEPETDEEILKENIGEARKSVAANAKVLKEKKIQLDSLKRNFTELKIKNNEKQKDYVRQVEEINKSTRIAKDYIGNLKKNIDKLSNALNSSMKFILIFRTNIIQ